MWTISTVCGFIWVIYRQSVVREKCTHTRHIFPPLDYKWDISTDMWLDGTRARLICPPTIPAEVSVRITDYIGYDRGLVHPLHPELFWSRGGYIHQHPYCWPVQFPPQLPSFCTSDTSSNCRRTRWVRTTLQTLSKIANYNVKLTNTVLRSFRLHHCRTRADEIANVSFLRRHRTSTPI